MKMKNKTTKLRTHTSSKKGRKFRKEKSAILFFNNPQFVSKNNYLSTIYRDIKGEQEIFRVFFLPRTFKLVMQDYQKSRERSR